MRTQPPLSILPAAVRLPGLKLFALFLLLAFLQCCFGQMKDYRGALNCPSSLNDYVWQGTLKLPKVKIPANR
jgi:hypothetical protein